MTMLPPFSFVRHCLYLGDACQILVNDVAIDVQGVESEFSSGRNPFIFSPWASALVFNEMLRSYEGVAPVVFSLECVT